MEIQESVEPRLSPGGVWVRIITSSGETLTERCLGPYSTHGQGLIDALKARIWASQHPTEKVYVVAYDGDTGTRVMTAAFVEPGHE